MWRADLFVSSLGVEIFAEGHDVQASLTKCWSDRWSRFCLSGINDQFDGCCDCLLGFTGHTSNR